NIGAPVVLHPAMQAANGKEAVLRAAQGPAHRGHVLSMRHDVHHRPARGQYHQDVFAVMRDKDALEHVLRQQAATGGRMSKTATTISVGYDATDDDVYITITAGTEEIQLTHDEGEFVFAMLATALDKLSGEMGDI